MVGVGGAEWTPVMSVDIFRNHAAEARHAWICTAPTEFASIAATLALLEQKIDMVDEHKRAKQDYCLFAVSLLKKCKISSESTGYQHLGPHRWRFYTR